MLINSLTSYIYTVWGAKYSDFNWRPEWYAFIRMQNKEIKERPFNAYKPVAHIIYFFDTKVLQRIGKDHRVTLDVRIRIVCGLINQLSPNKVSIPMKREFMECIWDTYKKFMREWEEYYFKYILQLPF